MSNSITIFPGIISGSLSARPSKSHSQRALAAALLAEGSSRIRNMSLCKDTEAAMGIVRSFGAVITHLDRGLIVNSPGFRELKKTLGELSLNCMESGLCLRMFSPIASLFPVSITLSGTGSLLKRDSGYIATALKSLGAKCSSYGGYPPFITQGALKGGSASLDGSKGSQFLTGMLMALPLTNSSSSIFVDNLKSKPYIDMTLQVMSNFGVFADCSEYKAFTVQGGQSYKPCIINVEGDWSSASFWLVAAAIKGKVEIKGLDAASMHADKAVIYALQAAGANIEMNKDTIMVSSNTLMSFDFDITHSPDLFPPLAVLAAKCRGVTRIKGIGRLKNKESNRSEAIICEFKKLGIRTAISGDEIYIFGNEKISGGNVKSHNDHRIAMAMAVAGLAADSPLTIDDCICVGKSYPEFFSDLKLLTSK